jgi:hypothetical protein
MNPTNFFTEKYIFMFESNRKNSNISDDDYLKATSAIFNGNYMVTALPFLPSAINQASAQTNVNQVTIASRIKQELGAGKATSGEYKGKLLSVISGDYTDRWGDRDTDGGSYNYYYNFFNVGAYDGSDVMLNAIRYAKTKIKIILKKDRLRIFNDGEPIDDKFTDSKFKPYEKGSKGQFGLGMSIVKKTVDFFGMDLRVVNEETGGVSFIIEKVKK